MDHIDWENPISDHPLNQGLVSWWLAGEENPYWGGPLFRDLCGRNHGTLVNNPEWRGPNSVQGSYGSLKFNGTSNYVSVASATTSFPVSMTVRGVVGPVGAARTFLSQTGNVLTGSLFVLTVTAGGAIQAAVRHVTGGTIVLLDGPAVVEGQVFSATLVNASAASRRLYVDGLLADTDTTNLLSTVDWNVTTIGAQRRSAVENYCNGFVGHASIAKIDATDSWYAAYHRELSQGYPGLLNRLPKRFFFSSADTGEVSITPDDATHSHAAESPTITQVHAISPADATHGHAAESPAITQVHAISPSDATHAHAAESPTLTQVHSLAPADATHGHTSESPSVSEGVAVFPDDATHAHAAESPTLTQVHIVSPADALHGHAAESPLITQVHVISPADALHAHYADAAVVSSIDGAFVLPTYFPPLRSDRGYTVGLRSDAGYSVGLRGEPAYGD